MILDVQAVTAFFLAGVGGVLALAALIAGLRSMVVRGEREAADRAHLLALVVAVLALVRLLAWPNFYLLLESYVPFLAPYGVMCAYGVTRVQPELVLALQWLMPAVLVLLAGWGAFAWIDHRAGGTRFRRARAVAIVPIALLALAQGAVEVVYLVSPKIDRPVTCCSQLSDLENGRVSRNLSPLALAGFDSPPRTLSAYFALNAVVIALALLAARRRRPRALPPFSLLLALLAPANLVVAQWAWLDAVAPRVLGLPYHHCLYETVTRAPAMGAAAIFTIAGNVALLGAAGLAPFRRVEPAAIDELAPKVQRAGALALASALVVVGIHLL